MFRSERYNLASYRRRGTVEVRMAGDLFCDPTNLPYLPQTLRTSADNRVRGNDKIPIVKGPLEFRTQIE